MNAKQQEERKKKKKVMTKKKKNQTSNNKQVNKKGNKIDTRRRDFKNSWLKDKRNYNSKKPAYTQTRTYPFLIAHVLYGNDPGQD